MHVRRSTSAWCRSTKLVFLDATKMSLQLAQSELMLSSLLTSMVFWSNISSFSERFNFCRNILKTFSMYWLSEICKLWWPNLVLVRWLLPERTPHKFPCVVLTGHGLSSFCNSWQFVGRFWTLSRSRFPETELRPNSCFTGTRQTRESKE